MTTSDADPTTASGFSTEELLRYARHLTLPEVGVEGQRCLRQARVLIIGAGGLGSPAALYLAAAGVGTLGLVDFDRVDLTNLQRQILHGTAAVGKPKLESAADRLRDLNPHVTVETFEERLTSANALEILSGFDVIVDGSDNFPTRYLVNDAAVLTGKPNVYGAILRFDGQASLFGEDGPCYRCLYAEPPPPELIPNCAEGGVLGVLPGIIGSIQALETVKVILGVGETLRGRLVLFDALRFQFRELKVRRDPACPVCGDAPTIRELIDYEAFCGLTGDGAVSDLDIDPEELRRRLADGEEIVLLDVREPFEWEIGHLPGATWVPLGDLPSRLGELSRAPAVVAYCHRGARSREAAALLRGAGHASAQSLAGGIDAWADRIDRSLPRY